MISVFTGGVVPDKRPYEFVECKGLGHPDTVTDSIADEISRRYSQHSLNHYGFILNHWVDKCVLIGGESHSQFGSSRMIRPMQLLVIGKAARTFNDESISLEAIARESAESVLSPLIANFRGSDLEISVFTNDYTGAGRPESWYRPTNLNEEVARPSRANDAVICCGFFPFSVTEQLTRSLIELLFSSTFRADAPHIGSDIKVLCQRINDRIDITACVPFVAHRTPSRSFYDAELARLKHLLQTHAEHLVGSSQKPGYWVGSLCLNTRDDEQTVYMSHYGSCLDTGDVGAVGRGNRGSGLITPGRPMSIEAPCGKNPRNHSGKILDIASYEIAREIFYQTGASAEVTISTQTGRLLSDPLLVVIHLSDAGHEQWERARGIAAEFLSRVEGITQRFVNPQS